MKLPGISEGKRRLRLYLSLLTAFGVYLANFLGERRIRAEDVFVEFLIYSVATFVVVYLVVTGLYWVIEGFGRDRQRVSTNGKNDTATLYGIVETFGLAYQKILLEISGMKDVKNQAFVRIGEQINESWLQTSLLYTYGLTIVCMLSKERDFLKSDVATELSDTVAKKIAFLREEEGEKYFKKMADAADIGTRATESVKEIVSLVLTIYQSFSDYEKRGDPLKPLHDYVGTATGLKSEQHRRQLREAGQIMCKQINEKLA